MLPFVRVRVHTYIAQSGVLPHLHVRTNVAYYVLCYRAQYTTWYIAAAFITGEDRHVILILASVP